MTLALETDDENPTGFDSEGIHVGLPQLELLFERLGTDKDDVTAAPKLSSRKHLYVKNQGR